MRRIMSKKGGGVRLESPLSALWIVGNRLPNELT